MLPAAVDEQLGVALAAELAKVQRDERAAYDGASRSSAYAGRKLYEVHVANVERARASGDVAYAAEIYSNIRRQVALPSMVLAEAERRTIGGAVREVGGGIAKDAADLATTTGGNAIAVLKAAPFILAAVAVLYLLALLPRRRA